MVFEALRTERGCLSYLIGCERTRAAVLVDPELALVERYLALATGHGLRPRYVLETHTHADHFTGARLLAARLDVPIVMHREAPAPFVDLRVEDGEELIVGELRIGIVHTPGHTRDSLCAVVGDHVLTGDTLLLGSVGRTDLPTGDPGDLYDSLFGKLLRLDGSLLVHPAHNYKGLPATTLDEQRAKNPRLAVGGRDAFVAMMRGLDLELPEHLTEALRTNATGGKTVEQIIQEAAERVSFMSMAELARRIESGRPGVTVLDVREADAYAAGHIPGAVHLPRGQIELRVDAVLPDPTVRVVVSCELGRISTIAAATLREMGFTGAIALDGGVKAWREAGHPLEAGPGANRG
jgi:glyoxylase-like metal-dependent hydrolase (beta-lactamase superfamily II)/rhodanese-related sulfurtransferase